MPRNVEAGNAPPIKVTNEEFLRALAGDDWERVPISWGAQSWVARPAGKHLAKRDPLDANYYTVSIFALAADGRFRRVKELFQRQFAFVIDDVGTKINEAALRATLPAPTYELETSPRNRHLGFKLIGATDARALEALVDAVVSDPEINPSLKDPGMKGVTRIVRLPVGANLKPEVMAKNGGKPWPHRLWVWEPSRAYRVAELAMWLGVDLSEGALAKFKDVSGSRKATTEELEADVFVRLFDARGELIDATPNDNGFVAVLCPWRHEHSDDRTDGTGYKPGSGGFQCHHGHCADRTMEDVRRWAAEECGEDLQRAQNDLLREVFAESPIDWDAVAAASAAGIAERPRADAKEAAAVSERGMRSLWFDGDAPPEPVAMVVEKIIPAQGLTFLGGQSGSAKTFLAIDIGVAVASGQPFFDLDTERCGALYCAAEGAATISSRLAAAKAARGVSEPLPFAVVRYVPDLADRGSRESFLNVLKQAAGIIREKHGVRVGLVIIDTLGAAFSMRDENAAGEMNAVCRAAAQVGDSVGAATLVLAHYGKAEQTGIRGSSAIRGAGESVLATLGDRDETTGTCTNRRWVHIKSRTGEEGEAHSFDLAHVFLAIDQNGEEIGAAKIVRTGRPVAKRKPGFQRSSETSQLQIAFSAAYERLAAGAPGHKVSAAALQDELRATGFLDADEKGRIPGKERMRFLRVKAALLNAGSFAERDGFIWAADE